jgi:hypothetical protein
VKGRDCGGKAAAFVCGLLLTACASQPPAPPPPPPPRLAASATAQRVVLLSFDGLGADALARESGLPAFEKLARDGATARVIGVDPTLTMPAHVSMLTGAVPEVHGVVSNRFHLPGTPASETARGMRTDSAVETLIQAAQRQGKRVGSVGFPTIDDRSPRRSANFGLAWTTATVPARIVELKAADFRREWVPPTWTAPAQRRRSFSPVMRARLEWSVPRLARFDVDVVAYDTTDDRVENYDVYAVESGEREIPVNARGWFSVSRQTAGGLYGSWSKFLEASPSLGVKVYWGSISRTEAWPSSFRSRIDERAGFWPGIADDSEDLDPVTYAEQLDRLAAFYRRAQVEAIRTERFDLLLLYQPQIDHAAHRYLGDPSGAAVLRGAFVAADHALASIGELLGESDALVVTGDHGLVVADRELRLNTLLAELGFGPRWRAFTSGAFAQLYRFGGPDDTGMLLAMLEASGYFERVTRKAATAHVHSGDIAAWAHPNVALSAADETPVLVDVRRGQHGALNTHPELQPPLFAVGQGVTPGRYGDVPQTAIARFVAALLGIAPPESAE